MNRCTIDEYRSLAVRVGAGPEMVVDLKAAVADCLDTIEALERRGEPEWSEILAERFRQDQKWSEQNHDPFLWLTILMEEVGEASQAALKVRTNEDTIRNQQALGSLRELRQEVVQVAAVALAMLECLSRDKWTWCGAT